MHIQSLEKFTEYEVCKWNFQLQAFDFIWATLLILSVKGNYEIQTHDFQATSTLASFLYHYATAIYALHITVSVLMWHVGQ